jgi:hypothetical protein
MSNLTSPAVSCVGDLKGGPPSPALYGKAARKASSRKIWPEADAAVDLGRHAVALRQAQALPIALIERCAFKNALRTPQL